MKLDKFLEKIQDACDKYIDVNLEDVLLELENNKTQIDKKFSEFRIDKINKKSWGIYVFYIEPRKTISTFEDLNNLWKTNEKDKRLHSPKAIKSRFQTMVVGNSICFYVGKSEDLKSRISQHIHQRTKYTTYGLKLSEHDRMHLDNTFSFSYFVVKTDPNSNLKDGMKCLIVTLERYLRSELKPLIGKQ